MSVITIGTRGLEAFPVFIEADIGRGLFYFNIVGLGDKAVTESKSRILAALKNSGFISPKTAGQKITVLLGPADIKKEGSHFDLPIAIAYLETCGYIETSGKIAIAAVGELSLDGRVRPVRNILLMILTAKNLGYKNILVPADNFFEASLIEGISIIGIETLADIVSILNDAPLRVTKKQPLSETSPRLEEKNAEVILLDIDTVVGQTEAKRALEIALAGKHHIAFYGPPGVGKSLLAKASAELLPPLSKEEAVEHAILKETAGLHNTHGVLDEDFFTPPFRDPHHTSSYSSILGTPYRLGELSLAHNGILFMDEFAEFDRRALESLRQPMEDGHIKSHRAGKTQTVPADSILIAATNLCRCGNYRSTIKRCTCSALNVEQYIKRISGPLADRIDIWMPLQEQNSVQNSGQDTERKMPAARENTGAEIKKRIAAVRKIQEERLLSLNIEPKTLFKSNKRKARVLLLKNIRRTMPDKVKKVLAEAVKNLALSARGADSVLSVARTIADTEGAADVQQEHILEALTYRKKF